MCGIAGLIHRGKSSNVGSELQGMLQALKHRGEDSTGYALYGDTDGKNFIMRFKVGENVGEGSSSVMEEERTLPYSLRYEISYDKKDLLDFSQKIESIPGVEILSMGKSLEVIKDLGNAKAVCDRYSLDKLVGTHAIGHARMATESGVDIKSAHPFWGYPFSDVSVVHNGQLTNYWNNRRALENKGMRFMSECDSELIAVYIAQKMREGASLEEGMKDSLSGLDGVFTYFVATKDSLGMAKDTMAAKPLVLYESDDLVAMGSEEIAIRSVLPQEIDTYDPFDGEVKVWQI
jgi:glutamate synthase domain-containing protein 1